MYQRNSGGEASPFLGEGWTAGGKRTCKQVSIYGMISVDSSNARKDGTSQRYWKEQCSERAAVRFLYPCIAGKQNNVPGSLQEAG